jgi:hypothetical protein
VIALIPGAKIGHRVAMRYGWQIGRDFSSRRRMLRM